MPIGVMSEALQDNDYSSKEVYEVGQELDQKFEELIAEKIREEDPDGSSAIDEISELSAAAQEEIYNELDQYRRGTEELKYDVLESVNKNAWNLERNIRLFDAILDTLQANEL